MIEWFWLPMASISFLLIGAIICHAALSANPPHTHKWSKWELRTMMHQFIWESEASEVQRLVRQCEDCGDIEIKQMVSK
jgi:hypothetical protein